MLSKNGLRKSKRVTKTKSLTTLKNKADKLFSLAIRKRDGKSRKSGLTQNLQCSHIFSRSNNLIRWDMDNALTLTAGEHLYWWHKEPAEAVEWAKKLLGDKIWVELVRKKNKPFKLTAKFIEERIKFLEDYISNL